MRSRSSFVDEVFDGLAVIRDLSSRVTVGTVPKVDLQSKRDAYVGEEAVQLLSGE
jgi:hypothetical protein